MFAGSYRRVPFHHPGRRPPANRRLINCVYVLVALALVYICCVLVSLVRYVLQAAVMFCTACEVRSHALHLGTDMYPLAQD